MIQKLNNIKVSHKLTIIIVASIIGSLCLLFIASTSLKSNLIAEREARLNAVIDSAMSQIQYLKQNLPHDSAQSEAKNSSAHYDLMAITTFL